MYHVAHIYGGIPTKIKSKLRRLDHVNNYVRWVGYCDESAWNQDVPFSMLDNAEEFVSNSLDVVNCSLLGLKEFNL